MSTKRLPLFNIIAVLVLILVSLPLSTPAAQGETPITPKDPLESELQAYPEADETDYKAIHAPEDQLNADYTYGAMSFGGAAFQLYDTTGTVKKAYHSYGCMSLTGNAYVDAPVYLPYNSIITHFDAYVYDTAADDGISVTLKRYDYKGTGVERIASLSTQAGYTGGGILLNKEVANHLVDSNNYNYIIEISLGGSTLKFCNATIHYRIPKDPIFPIALPLINN